MDEDQDDSASAPLLFNGISSEHLEPHDTLLDGALSHMGFEGSTKSDLSAAIANVSRRTSCGTTIARESQPGTTVWEGVDLLKYMML